MLSNTVSDDYFETIGVPIVEGRHFNDTDREDSERVAIVNEQARSQLLSKPGRDWKTVAPE